MTNSYFGHQSTDAEIFLNLEAGTAKYDYSLTKSSRPINNNRVVYSKDKISILEQTHLEGYYMLRFVVGWAGCMVFTNIMLFENILHLALHSKTHLSTQIYYQKFAKMACDCYQYEDITIGKLETNYLKIKIPKNLYVKYFLDGDYQTQIKSISLTRNIVKCIKYGTQQIQRQDGWNMCFEFKNPPRHGSCIVRYL